MPEFLPQFVRVIGKGWQDVPTPLVWLQWRKTYLPQPQCGRCHQDGTGVDKPLRMLLAASEAIHWKGASRTMLIYQDTYQHWGTDLEEICTRCWYKQKIWHFNAHFGKKNARFHRVLCVSMWFFSSHTSIWQ